MTFGTQPARLRARQSLLYLSPGIVDIDGPQRMPMPQAIITPPVIEDSMLVFDDVETRAILTFFWPRLSADFNKMTISTEVRRFAQAILVAAIDASYSLGWIDSLFSSVSKPANLPALGKKLARNFVKHWWKHAKAKDLESVKVYESVRRVVANNFGQTVRMLVLDNTAKARLGPFVVASVGATLAWV